MKWFSANMGKMTKYIYELKVINEITQKYYNYILHLLKLFFLNLPETDFMLEILLLYKYKISEKSIVQYFKEKLLQ